MGADYTDLDEASNPSNRRALAAALPPASRVRLVSRALPNGAENRGRFASAVTRSRLAAARRVLRSSVRRNQGCDGSA